MNINQLITIVKNKIEKNVLAEYVEVLDKTFLHKKHESHQLGKYHIRIEIKSLELKKMSRIQSTKKIYSILDQEIKKYIHSIQVLII